MLQRGLKGSNPLMGLSFWRTDIIAADALSGQFLWSGVSPRSWRVAADAHNRCCSGRSDSRSVSVRGIARHAAEAQSSAAWPPPSTLGALTKSLSFAGLGRPDCFKEAT